MRQEDPDHCGPFQVGRKVPQVVCSQPDQRRPVPRIHPCQFTIMGSNMGEALFGNRPMEQRKCWEEGGISLFGRPAPGQRHAG